MPKTLILNVDITASIPPRLELRRGCRLVIDLGRDVVSTKLLSAISDEAASLVRALAEYEVIPQHTETK